MKILIKSVGFIGDNLFASSVIKKLKEQHPGCKVDFLCSKVQPFELIKNNPYVDNVYLTYPDQNYDIIYQLSPIHRRNTPCEQFQSQCDIINISSDFTVYTNKSLDQYVQYIFSQYSGKKIIAWLSNWEERSFLFTEEEYKRGIDVPNLGYGGKHRNIEYIINEINNNSDFILIQIGKPSGIIEDDLYSVSEYSLTASILKNCDYFIGAEGGLANLASGVGTKTIITGDFVHQLYGWNGVIEKCEEPKLGPKYYFGEDKHITLNPYLTDEEVVNNIIKIINGI